MNQDFFENFNGEMLVSEIDISELINGIEAYVSGFKYQYKTSDTSLPEITIEVSNGNIPHLLGLSNSHHKGLPTYNPSVIFEGLKNDWSLENLKKGDEKWYLENQDKVIGVTFLYQIFHIIDCEVYTTKYMKNRNVGSRVKRDNIYFIIFKSETGKNFSVELSPLNGGNNSFFPRSLKINDSLQKYYHPIHIEFINKSRIKSKKTRIKKVSWGNN